MRPLLRVVLPIGSVLMLAAAAGLFVRYAHDISAISPRAVTPRVEAAASRPVARKVAHDPPPASPALPAKPRLAATQPAASATAASTAVAAKSTNGAAIGIRPVQTRILARDVNTLPEAVHPYFLSQVVAQGGLEYGITMNRGVFVSSDGGKTWEERSDGLPVRVIYPFKNDPIATLTSIGVDPSDGRHVAVTTATAVYLSRDAGLTWKAIRLNKAIKHSTYITTVALSPFGKSTIAVGTTFSGFFVTHDDGKTWKSHAHDLGFLYQGAGFYEEVAALAYSPVEQGVIYMAVGFGGGVYRSTSDGKHWTATAFPGRKNEVVCELNARSGARVAGKDPWVLSVATQRAYWSFDPASRVWKKVGTVPPPPPPSLAKLKRMADASNRTGIYISPWDAGGSELNKWIAFLKKNNLDTLVVDVKDDRGHVTYNTRVPFAWKLGAVHPYFNIQHLIKVAHANGIYVVGRLVVFKDKYLYRYDHNRYAIWDPRRNRPWGFYQKEIDPKTGKVKMVQKEFWVDPFSQRVWRYNLAIAKELQKDGINEIQFDYIRFPSEVTAKNAVYRFRRKGMTEEDALESFLKMARSELSIPISVDIFGYNGWYPNAGWVGQDIEVYANYADVVSPMYYPSLFPRDFLPQMPYLERAKYLYRMGTWRAQRIVDGRAVIRPFVQAFLLGSYELKMNKAEYSNYLRSELVGAQQADSSGFLLWNFGTDYYMVTFPLGRYTERPPFTPPGEVPRGLPPAASGPKAAATANAAPSASPTGPVAAKDAPVSESTHEPASNATAAPAGG